MNIHVHLVGIFEELILIVLKYDNLRRLLASTAHIQHITNEPGCLRYAYLTCPGILCIPLMKTDHSTSSSI
jgi:hypothetical protein